jgi:hypothetical protein
MNRARAGNDLCAPRFWIPEGSEIALLDNGFMPDPEGRWTSAYVPEVESLEEIRAPCLILIGEPGLGKTTALKVEFARIESELTGDDRAHWVALGDTRDRGELRAAIFEADVFREWIEAEEGTLHLFLDSLDEARVHITRVASLLIEGLATAPVSRLILRLTCRSADRHQGLEAELEKRFAGEGEFEVWELAPLTKRDVVAAGGARGLDGEAILGEIISRGLQPLAMIPESLEFLLDAAARTGELPASRAEAFGKGLLLLAEEADEDRRRDRDEATIRGAGARLALAKRIAGALVLSGRVAARVDGDEPGVDDAAVAKLTGGHELDREAAIPIEVEASAENLRAVLGTSIFTGHGVGRIGFAQASYAEYLCAAWLADGALSTQQVEDLLFTDVGGRLRVVPQLHEVASWLAALDKDFLGRLLEQDPVVLLRAEPDGLDAGGRRRLVDALLTAAGDYEVERFDRRRDAIYPRLDHPGLADQLRAVILDPDVSSPARQVACDIAGACRLEPLESDLVDLALDSDADLQVRGAALGALRRFAGPPARRALRPLGLEPQPEDDDDEVKGAALRVLWPGAVSASELFDALDRPKRRDLYGLYKDFILNGISKDLGPRDLPVALRWAAGVPVEHHPIEPMSTLRERLLVAAWPLLEEGSPVLEPYIDVVTALLAGETALLSEEARQDHPEVFADVGRCRLILSRLIERATGGDLESFNIVQSQPPLLHPDDTGWLVRRLEEAGTAESGELCARILLAHVAFGGGDELSVLEARESNAVLRRLSKGRYAPVRLDSVEAERARRAHERYLRREPEDEEDLDPFDIVGNTRASLDRFEAGEADGYWLATKWLEIHSVRKEREYFVSDLAGLPGWNLIDDKERGRLRTASRDYLGGAPPDPSGWFARGGVNWPATAGYRALRSVYEDDKEAAADLPDDLWRRWAPVVVDWWRNDGAERGEGEFNDWAIAQLVSHAPDDAARWFERRLDREIRGDGLPSVLHRFRLVWHPLLEAAVLRRVRGPGSAWSSGRCFCASCSEMARWRAATTLVAWSFPRRSPRRRGGANSPSMSRPCWRSRVMTPSGGGYGHWSRLTSASGWNSSSTWRSRSARSPRASQRAMPASSTYGSSSASLPPGIPGSKALTASPRGRRSGVGAIGA